MKRMFISDATSKGLQAFVKYSRPEFSSVCYQVELTKNGLFLANWDGGYFIGEENTGNSKKSMIDDWDNFINNLQL